MVWKVRYRLKIANYLIIEMLASNVSTKFVLRNLLLLSGTFKNFEKKKANHSI